MWLAIRTFISMLWMSPITKAVVASTVKDLTLAGSNVLMAAVPAIQQAAAMENTKGTDKLNYVVDKLKDEITDLPKDVMTNVVTSVYRAYVQKEV